MAFNKRVSAYIYLRVTTDTINIVLKQQVKQLKIDTFVYFFSKNRTDILYFKTPIGTYSYIFIYLVAAAKKYMKKSLI